MFQPKEELSKKVIEFGNQRYSQSNQVLKKKYKEWKDT